LSASAPAAVGLGDNQKNFKMMLMQRFEGRNRKIRSSHEYDGGPFFHWFRIFFFIRRLYISRFKELMRSMNRVPLR